MFTNYVKDKGKCSESMERKIQETGGKKISFCVGVNKTGLRVLAHTEMLSGKSVELQLSFG